MVRPIFHKIGILMIYSQLVFINEGTSEVLMILVQDFYLLNLSKSLDEQTEMHLHLLAKFTKCFRHVQVKVLKKISREP